MRRRVQILMILCGFLFSACSQSEKALEEDFVKIQQGGTGPIIETTGIGQNGEFSGAGQEGTKPVELTPSSEKSAIDFSISGGVKLDGMVENNVEVISGAEIDIEWNAEGADSVTLMQDGTVIAQNLDAHGSYKVIVSNDSIYSINAKSGDTLKTSSINLKATDTICLGQPNCTTNIGHLKGFSYIYYQPFACTRSDGNICLMVPDAGNNRVLRYCGDNIKTGIPDLVLGQPDFSSALANRGGLPSASTLNEPRGVWCDGKIIIVADHKNNRVLVWNDFENLKNGDAASAVMGQPNFQSNLINRGGVCSEKSLSLPSGVWVDPENHFIFVADGGNGRVLIKKDWPNTDSDQSFDMVMGQANFTGCSNNRGGKAAANTLFGPVGVSTKKGKVIISDSFNNRVLIFNDIPSSNGQAADFVIGQLNFSLINPNQGTKWLDPFSVSDFGIPSPSSLVYPVAAYADDKNNLWVSDKINHRVLRFPMNFDGALSMTETPPAIAAQVIGFETFTQKWTDIFPGTTTFVMNNKMAYNAGASPVIGCRMFVTVTGTSIREFDACSTKNYITATGVIGQPTFNTQGKNHAPPTDGLFNSAYSVFADEKGMWVADPSNHRVLGFEGLPVFSGAKAKYVLGQNDFLGEFANKGQSLPSESSLKSPGAVTADSERIYVSDTSNSRLVVYKRNEMGAPEGEATVIGQKSFTSAEAPPLINPGCSKFRPSFAQSDGNSLWLVDTDSYKADEKLRRYRVLDFDISSILKLENEAVLANGNIAVGEPDCQSTGAKELYIPQCVYSDGQHLIVCDSYNNKIIYYETIPTDSGAKPTYVINTLNPADGSKSSPLYIPFGAVLHRGLIFIADTLNNRVLVLTQPQADDSPKTLHVFGQSNYTLNSANGGETLNGDAFHNPRRIWLHGDFMFVADDGNQRVVIKNIKWLLNKYGTTEESQQ